MPRLPQPGGDPDNWGTILNTFLSQSHDSNGDLKANSVGSSQIQAGALTKSDVGLGNVDNTSDASKPVSTAMNTALTGKVSFVLVSTGSEARPSGTTFCIWSGGTVQPTNMGANDIWFAAAPPADTTPPSVPSGLATSSVSSTSFSISWVASTGTPTLYELFLDGVSGGTTSSTSYSFSGKTASTTYSVTVRARDAAGNWSAQSSALSVQTDPPGNTPEHSIWASTAPYATTLYSDGGSNLVTANIFYTMTSGTAAWKAAGVRFYVPTSGASSLIGKNIAIRLSIIPASGTAPNVQPDWANYDEQVLMTNLVAGWNEIHFTAPHDFAHDAADRLAVMGRIYTTDPATGNGMYLHSGTLPTTLAVQANDNSQLWLASDSERRGWNNVGGYVNVFYGYDIIVSES